ncbi:MAG: GNAT family N-acetyltransferase [Armatimonadetes bacterium]|nr:GNAT family N-acetyltransferase [Armatimonadota bacterium]
MEFRQHSYRLCDGELVLRPFTEADWESLHRWNNDPEVLYYAEGGDVTHRDMADVRHLYTSASQAALCFIIECEGAAIGEGWLQAMNLDRYLHGFPGKGCRRIDLMIGEKAFWGRGIGTRVIRLLSAFAFAQNADILFGCDVADYNPRSLRAFEKAGYIVYATIPQPSGSKAGVCYDLMLRREDYDNP